MITSIEVESPLSSPPLSHTFSSSVASPPQILTEIRREAAEKEKKERERKRNRHNADGTHHIPSGGKGGRGGGRGGNGGFTFSHHSEIPLAVQALSEHLTYKIRLYIQMQLCEDLTLSDWIRNKEREVVSDLNMPIIHQILCGLQHVHMNGVMHRDLKPSNLFITVLGSALTPSGKRYSANASVGERREILMEILSKSYLTGYVQFLIKIGDFGLAKGIDLKQLEEDQDPEETSELESNVEDCESVTVNSNVNMTGRDGRKHISGRVRRRRSKKSQRKPSGVSGVGTLTYSSPEQLSGKYYSTKSDIYSLGIIMFELYFKFDTAMERVVILDKLRKGELPPGFREKFPEESSLILSMTNRKPSKRPSASELLCHPYVLEYAPVVHMHGPRLRSPPPSPHHSTLGAQTQGSSRRPSSSSSTHTLAQAHSRALSVGSPPPVIYSPSPTPKRGSQPVIPNLSPPSLSSSHRPRKASQGAHSSTSADNSPVTPGTPSRSQVNSLPPPSLLQLNQPEDAPMDIEEMSREDLLELVKRQQGIILEQSQTIDDLKEELKGERGFADFS